MIFAIIGFIAGIFAYKSQPEFVDKAIGKIKELIFKTLNKIKK